MVAVTLYALFSVSYARVAAWLPDHPVLGRIFFFEFAPWPWISLVWIGLALGWVWALEDTPERRVRYLVANAALMVALVYLGRLWLRIRSIAGRRLPA